MKVATLAAGRGSRLGKAAPGGLKVKVELAGRSLLDWQRKAYALAGLNDRLIVVRPEAALEPVVGERVVRVSGFGGPMDSLFAIADVHAARGLVVGYGDIVFHPDIASGLLNTSGSDICIVADRDWLSLWSLRFRSVLQDAESFLAEGDSLVQIGGRATDAEHIQGQFIGLMKLSPRGFGILKSLRQDGDDTTTLLARVLANGIPVDIFHVRGRWCEIDTRQDIAVYRKALNARTDWSHDWRKH